MAVSPICTFSIVMSSSWVALVTLDSILILLLAVETAGLFGFTGLSVGKQEEFVDFIFYSNETRCELRKGKCYGQITF